MSTVGERAAATVESAVTQLIDFVESCDDRQWAMTTSSEGWTVAALSHHVADGFAAAEDWIEHFRGGQDVPGTPDTHNAGNAQHAARYARVTRQEVVELAQRNGAALAATIRRLGPEDLEKGGAHGPAGGAHLTVADIIGATDRHTLRHLAGARESI